MLKYLVRQWAERWVLPDAYELSERIAIFKNGTANCTRGCQDYKISILKFMEEWETTSRYYDLPVEYQKDSHEKPESWALYLKSTGMEIIRYIGVIEKKEKLFIALKQRKLIICDISIPNENDPSEKSRHSVMVLGLFANKLLIHDPLPYQCDAVDYKSIKDKHSGANLEVTAEYFFASEEGVFKPQLNTVLYDTGFSFLTFSRFL